MTHYNYLIIGGGMSADAAAHGIRETGATGSIGLISAEPHPPYNRPPLSKGLWKGESPQDIWRKINDTGATLHLGRQVDSVDAAGKRVMDDRGDTHTFDKLLLATGATPRRLWPSSEQIIYYRTYDDYRQLWTLAQDALRFAVIGGGFIGSEIAAALRMQGRDVTMFVPDPGLGARVFPSGLSLSLVEYYREKGIRVHTGQRVSALQSQGGRIAVQATTGDRVDVDVVVAGLGVEPSIELAKQVGLRVDNGVLVDEFLHTSHPDIFAAGDVANFHNPALGMRMRVEHEDNANSMGRTAGLNMAGQPAAYDHLPFFYSDLFDLGYEAVGDVDARHESVADWKEPFREGVVYYLREGRVRGVLLWNTWGQVDAARALIAEPGPFTPEALRGRLPA
jgi:NADPH-dependent 2,4-dienoyl-CoA reductase/sulfur reductase-like enzyme